MSVNDSSRHGSTIRTLGRGAVLAAFVLGWAPGPAMATCPLTVCGANGPSVNDFPINGVSLDGEENRDGVKLLPDSLTPPPLVTGGCWQDVQRLDVVDGAFVGRRADGSIACTGDELRGARFQVEISDSKMSIRIRDVRLVRTWTRGHQEWLPAYLLAPDRVGVKSICAAPQAWLDAGDDVPVAGTADQTSDAGAAALPGKSWRATKILRARDPDQYALLVVGEAYDLKKVQVIPARRRDGGALDATRFMNIACQGDALAKMRLLGYDPSDDRPAIERDERQSTLKMITAKYCELDPDVHTVQGMSIMWVPGDSEPPRAPRTVVDALEARWDKDGAICLDRPRLTAEAADRLRACGAFTIPTCTSDGRSTPEPRPPGRVYWTTYTIESPVKAAAQ